jgi:hypothetical protein
MPALVNPGPAHAYHRPMKTPSPGRRPASLCACSALFLLCAQLHAASAAERVAAGKWESAMTTAGETRTVSFCIGAEEAAGINGGTATGRAYAEKKAQKSGGTCSIRSYEIKGDTVSYTLACGERTIADTTTFHGDTAEGVKVVTAGGKAVTSQLKSRRIGNCP